MTSSFRALLPFSLVLAACSGGVRGTPMVDFGLGTDSASGTDGANDGGAVDATPMMDTGLPPTDGGGMVDAPAPEPCPTPGATEMVPCGMCGTVARFCGSDHTWAYGVCGGETGVCVPGTTSMVACGMCGMQSATCNATCTWDPSSACSGEGTCAPGTRTRTAMGCPAGQTQEVLCNASCTYDPTGTCMGDPCPTPGATDSVACGMCGTQTRFCDASHVWDYATCMGEHGCMPGTTGTTPCGMCGTQTAHCDATCTEVPVGACTGEGVCAPGTTMRTATGCPAGQMHVMQCDPSCGYTIEVSPCTSAVPVDVTFLLDATGSNSSKLAADIPTIESACIAPMLAIMGVDVGVSYSGEFPVDPYGVAGDKPFAGGIQPDTSMSAITTNITGRPMFSGSDVDDATVEAISMLSGGGVAMSSTPLTCTAGRVAGGCWRAGTRRVIILHTDSPIHNGPDPASAGLLGPYSGISPAPATWPTVQTQLTTEGVMLIWIDTGASVPGPAQFDRMLTDLGQPLTDHHIRSTTADITTICGLLVPQIRTLAGM